MREGYRKVSHEEFGEFLRRYPGGLEHDCTTICDPPIHNYCDWSKAKSPIGTLEAHMQARQAYCFYADSRGGEDEFYVRTPAG